MVSYDKFNSFVHFFSGAVWSFFDIIFPNKYCESFAICSIKALSCNVEYYNGESDSNAVHNEIQPDETSTCNVARKSSSDSGDDGYDQVSSAGSNQSKPNEN